MKRPSRRHGFTVIELLVVIGLIVFLIAMLLPSLFRTRHGDTRVKCSNNLRQIGLALIMYMDANRGQFPSTGFNYTALPTLTLSETGRQFADGAVLVNGVPQAGWNNVPASWFLLAKAQGLSMEVFTCPTSSETKDMLQGDPTAPNNIGDIIQHANFTSIQNNLSYGFAPPETNEAGLANGYHLTNALTSDFAIAADRYQGNTAGGAPRTHINGTPANQQKMNSANHGKDGQNVMYADAHVSFENSCFVGVNKNNIYYADHGNPSAAPPTNFDLRIYTNGGAGAKANVQLPTNADDSVLVPWAADNQ